MDDQVQAPTILSVNKIQVQLEFIDLGFLDFLRK